MPELSTQFGIAVELEANAGTWDAPTMAANALRLAQRPGFRWGYAASGERPNTSVGGFGTPPSAGHGGRWGRLSIMHRMAGSGDNDTPPALAEILQTFMAETINAGTSVEYVPSTAQKKAVSILHQMGNKEVQLRGAIPERLIIRGPEDQNFVVMEADMVGNMDVAVAEKAIDAMTFANQASVPAEFRGAMTVGGTAMIFDSFELDFGITAVPYRISRAETSHLLFGVVTQINPVLRFPGEVVALSAHNPFTRMAAPATPLALSLAFGTAAGNIFTITADHAEYVPEGSLVDRQALEYYDMTLAIRRPASGTFLKITHT